MAISLQELSGVHPCFALGPGKNNKGRIHLPVSPGCNIGCRYCRRDVNDDVDTDQRPGVTHGIITPQEAVSMVRRAVALCPEITVVGIAGPGDTLATPYALETFRLLREVFPDLLQCMSTNGLLLCEKADEITDAQIDTLTVTVNAVDPDIQAQIINGVHWHGHFYTGREAARILIENQLAGIEKVSRSGITVKVNTVLIPEINAFHVKEVARTVASCGAQLYNIIPLIPQNDLGWCTAPGCGLIEETAKQAGQYIRVFRHCQRCRADAAGIPGGRDVSGQIYLRQVMAEDTFSHG